MGISCVVRVDGVIRVFILAVVVRLGLMELSVIFLKIHSGVRQGCVISLILYGIEIDWVLKTSIMEKAGIS